MSRASHLAITGKIGALESVLWTYGRSIAATSEWSTLLNALHDMTVMLEGVHIEEPKE